MLVILGFSLLSLVMALVFIPIIVGHPHSTVDFTKVNLFNLKQALLTFDADCQRYPTTAEGLDALVNAPLPTPSGWHQYMDKVPVDFWGRPFVYIAPAADGSDFDLYSLGRDGTTDDIHLRDLN